MKQNRLLSVVVALVLALPLLGGDFDSWPKGKEPSEISGKLTDLLLSTRPESYKPEGYESPGDVRKADAQIIDRGEFKLVCVAAMGEKDARRVRLCLSLDGDGAYAVKNHVTKEILKKDGRDVWSVAALANGIDLTLPSQERVLITLEKK